jgi:hypothetical protein
MKSQLLIEQLTPIQAGLMEMHDSAKNIYLNGILMQADVRNGNKRVYPLEEISRAVESIQQRITEGHFIMGELNHPDSLSIDLSRVSHAITEIKMDGANAVGKCKILNTPMGNIAKGLLEGGIKLGVSSRGTGNVTNEGFVSDFNFVTVDIVATPSAPNAYPNMIKEAMENQKVVTLAEALVHDKAAQKHFQKEIFKFIEAVSASKL